MKKTLPGILPLLVFFMLCASARAATFMWANTNGGDWDIATNWTPPQVPASGDDAVITNAGTYTVTNNGSVTLGRLILGGTNGIQTLSLVSLTLTNTSLVNSNGVLNWSGGDLENSLTILQGGTLSISNSVTFSLNNNNFGYTNISTLTNYGTVIWAGNATSFGNGQPAPNSGGATIYNAGDWQAVADNTIQSSGTSTNLFINAGTLEKTGGSGTSTVNWSFDNPGGTVNTPAGSFSMGNWTGSGLVHGNAILSGGTISGTLASNALMNFSAMINGSLTVSSNAVANWNGGDLEGALTVAPGGTLGISNSVTFSINNNNFGYTNISTLTNYGTVVWAGNAFSFGNGQQPPNSGGAIIYNAGDWQAVADNTLQSSSTSTNLFINAGTLEKTGGSGISTVNWSFSSSGFIETTIGAFTLNWNGPSTLHGNLTLAGSIIATPLTVASNAVLNLSGSDLESSLTVLPGGTLTFSNSVTFSINNNNFGYTNISTLTNYGTVVWAGNITSYGNGQPPPNNGGAIIYNAGLWEAVGDDTIQFGSTASNLFVNAGTLEKIGGSGTSTINWSFDSEGGTLETPVNYFTFAGNWSANNLVRGNASVSGNVGGIIASNAVLNWLGGDLEGALTVAQGGTLAISNSVTFSINNNNFGYTNISTLTNYGTVIWAGNVTSYGNGQPFPNSGGAIIYNAGDWQAVADNTIQFGSTASNLFINAGTLEKTGGSGTSTINWSFDSEGGALETPAGYFTFSGSWNGSHLVRGNANVSGNIGGIIGSNAVLNWFNGDLEGALTVAQGSALSISNNVTFSLNNNNFGYTNISTLTNYGTVVWAGNITSYGNGQPVPNSGGALIYNAGLWQAVADGTIQFASTSSNLFINAGTLEKTGGSGTSTINWSLLNNGGILGSQTNTLSLAGNYDLTGGTLNVGINGLANNGIINLSGSPAALTGALSANLNNGYVPATDSSFSVLNYSSESGAFTNFDLPFPVAWQTNYGSTVFTLTVLNVRPVLNVISPQNLDEQTTLNVNATATDPDSGQSLAYALVSGPGGLNVSSGGAISWTPNESQGPSSNVVFVQVTDNGTPALSATNSFVVTVNEINVPPQLTVPSDQIVNEQTTLNVSAAASDSDIPANPLTFALIAPPGGMTIDTNTGAISWTPTEAQGPGVYTVKVVVTDLNTNAVNQQSFSVTNSFAVTVNEVNTAPGLTLLPNQTLTEQTPLNENANATDSDIPANPLTFALVSGPTGLNVAANGNITWTPTEAQGPGVYTVFVEVSDTNSTAVNAKSLSVTNSFQITVNESNSAPVLTLPANTNINELAAYSASATATDSDIPANPLAFALVSGPSGLTVSPSGAISWTPTEVQGPGTNIVTISVTDTNPPAVNATSLSVTNSYQIIVNEVNSAPMLGTLTDRAVNPGQTISFTATATDTDSPPNTLTFSLVSPPAGAGIASSSGLFNWRPAVAQAGTTNAVQVRVTDNGVPPLSDTKLFTVIVNPLAPVVLTPVGYTNGQFTLMVNGTIGPDYIISTSTNLTQWSDLLTNLSPATPFQFNSTNLGSSPGRFYRARLSP
jgi:Putative Ig domain